MHLSPEETSDIFAIARRLEAHIAEHWQRILEAEGERLAALFASEGDAAYGVYQNHLFKPFRDALEAAGLKARPALPGDFQSSREWGNSDESEQQRWMWSAVFAPGGEALGTLVHVIHHDHQRFRVPFMPEVIALGETEKAEVEAALSSRSPDFAAALEFRVWYAEYLKASEAR